MKLSLGVAHAGANSPHVGAVGRWYCGAAATKNYLFGTIRLSPESLGKKCQLIFMHRLRLWYALKERLGFSDARI